MSEELLKKLFVIFRKCFPELGMPMKVFSNLIGPDISRILYETSEEKPTGFSVIRNNSIVLICVDPDYHDNGIGSRLLVRSEELIKKAGYDTAVLGRNPYSFFMGAVIDNFSHKFFMRHGYYAYNGCLSMAAQLDDDLFIQSQNIQHPDDLKILIDSCDEEEAEQAVRNVEPKWLDSYKRSGHLITAYIGSRIVGFSCISITADTLISEENEKIAVIDYIGVLKNFRNMGIGSALLDYSLRFQKQAGCTRSFISYTSLDKWYTKFGFEEFMWYWLGEKSI